METRKKVSPNYGPVHSSSPSQNSRKTRSRRRGDAISGLIFVAPAILIVFALMLYPILYSGYLSLTDYNFVYDTEPTFIGFDNYIAAFKDPDFINALTNTAVYTVFYLVSALTIAFILALSLYNKLRFMSFYRSAVFVPIVVPLSLAGLIFVWMLQPNYGLVNQVIGDVLGLEFLTREWLSSGNTAMAAIVVVSLWATTGFLTILFLAGLQAIPTEILEAAEVDGVNGWQKVFSIIIPSMRPTFLITGIWATLQALKVFIEPMVLTDGGPAGSTTVLYQYIYKNALNYFEMGYASAMGYILGGIIIVLMGVNYLIVRERK